MVAKVEFPEVKEITCPCGTKTRYSGLWVACPNCGQLLSGGNLVKEMWAPMTDALTNTRTPMLFFGDVSIHGVPAWSNG
jgi:hypothetical protein